MKILPIRGLNAQEAARGAIFDKGISASLLNRTGVNPFGYSPAEVSERMRESRKINSSGDANVLERWNLMKSECEKRDVKFLPAQVLRPLYRNAGI